MEPFTPEQVNYLAKYLAKTFISRTDVKAEQMPFHKGSAYRPIHESWKMDDLRAHVRGDKTFGHYLLNEESMVKFFAFDIDLEKKGTYCDWSNENHERYDDVYHGTAGTNYDPFDDIYQFKHFNPREAWLDHSHKARPWMIYQMRILVESLGHATKGLGLKTLATYSGSKGVHVYGIFDEPVPAEVAREVAFEVLERAPGQGSVDDRLKFVPTRGKNFYHLAPDWESKDLNLDRIGHFDLFDNFTVEVFPKQSHIEPMRLGNLMRLDFGKNLKAPTESTFIIDIGKSHMRLEPHDTFEELQQALELGYGW